MKTTTQQKIMRYDTAYKQLLSHPPLLAYIMKNTLDEYRDAPLDAVIACIGQVSTDQTPVNPKRLSSPLDFGLTNESTSFDEGTMRFDTVFRAQLPGKDGSLGLIVNVEPQAQHAGLGYPLVKRAMYYCARLLSMQGGTMSAAETYRGLSKVCSIWICVNAPCAERNSITEYATVERCIVGDVRRPVEDYDLQNIVLVGLPPQGGYNEFIGTMATLFSFKTGADEKMRALEDQLGPELAREFEGDARHMGSLGAWVLEQGLEEGREQGLEQGLQQGRTEGARGATAESIRSLMKTLSLSMEQAMDALEIPAADRQGYRDEIGESQHGGPAHAQ